MKKKQSEVEKMMATVTPEDIRRNIQRVEKRYKKVLDTLSKM